MNYKILVQNSKRKIEAQKLFFELGYKWNDGTAVIKDSDCTHLVAWDDGKIIDFSNRPRHNHTGWHEMKELVISELKDMVVLKRNCVDDATHKSQSGFKWFVTRDNKIHSYSNKQWVFISDDPSDLQDLKPIEKKEMKMKEYLDPDNGYALITADDEIKGNSNWIEVPEGADSARYCDACVEFYKNDFGMFFSLKRKNWEQTISSKNVLLQNIIWQRSETEKVEGEHLKGIDATLAERQATYGSFEDVAFVTESVMSILSKVRPNGLSDLPNPHRMSLYMIASKMARIVNGDFNHKDSWHDIGGYAKLVEDLIDGNS